VILALVSSAIGAFLYLRMIVLSLAKETENTVEKYPISILQYIVLGVCTVGLLGGWLIIIL
jgi:NADH:ubiquinone oxidoreductase subunit 2 (subunit N)